MVIAFVKLLITLEHNDIFIRLPYSDHLFDTKFD